MNQPLLPFPDKRYTVIYADPAWEYDDTQDAGNRGAVHKYKSVMTVDDICEMPVPAISADDCILFMWVTMPKLREALRVLNAWEFEFKTTAFTWLKFTEKKKLFWGMGRWTRSNPELCWLATKGHPQRVSKGVHSVIDNRLTNTIAEDATIARHSEKPNEARERIVELCGDVPRIELFARKRYRGWDTWGNEVNTYYEEEAQVPLW